MAQIKPVACEIRVKGTSDFFIVKGDCERENGKRMLEVPTEFWIIMLFKIFYFKLWQLYTHRRKGQQDDL